MSAHILLFAALAAAAGPQDASGLPPTFCAELTVIMRAAGESPPFASIQAVPPRPMLGFDEPCTAYTHRATGRFGCEQDSARFTTRALADETARCLPGAVGGVNEHDPESFDYRIGNARISIDAHTPVTADLRRYPQIGFVIYVSP